MHIQTHVMSGWCIGNLFDLNPRERLFCMLAASLHDFDGLGIIFGQDFYWKFHHILGHNVLFGVILALLLTYFSKNRFKAFWVYLGLFHVHILMDLLGSGELWTISYLWPFSDMAFLFKDSWPLFSWQNILTGFCFLFWTVWIAVYKMRTPLENIMPSLDKQLVQFTRNLFKIEQDKGEINAEETL